VCAQITPVNPSDAGAAGPMPPLERAKPTHATGLLLATLIHVSPNETGPGPSGPERAGPGGYEPAVGMPLAGGGGGAVVYAWMLPVSVAVYGVPVATKAPLLIEPITSPV
jgi:hypothetical protein